MDNSILQVLQHLSEKRGLDTPFLEPLGIYTLGRFGEWDYANSDQCIKRGMELAAELRTHGTSKRTDDERIVLSRDKVAFPQAGS